MKLKLFPEKISGSITPPPSKSQSHRILIAAALAKGTSVISNVAFSKDIEATLTCMTALGATCTVDGSTVTITGIGGREYHGAPPTLDCGESGSTLRFLIPIALAVAGGGIFKGKGRLMQRPQEPYFEIFRKRGIFFQQDGDTLTLRGKLKSGEYALAGDVSSQFITGLLYVLPLLPGNSKIALTTHLESLSYIHMTMDTQAHFGVVSEKIEQDMQTIGFAVNGSQSYLCGDFSIEPDWSQAAFFYAAKGIGNSVDILGMRPDSRQGDRVIDPYYRRLCDGGAVHLDVSDCPDLVPALAVQAALRTGEKTYIENAARLRIKESDRLAAVTTVLNALGAKIKELPDSLEIDGVSALQGGAAVSAHNDHRIAMMTAVAATRCDAPIILEGAESVSKSYPNFWEHTKALGLCFEECAE